MTDNWQKLGEVTARITGRLAPVSFIVSVDGPLAVAVMTEAMKAGIKPETVIGEALRSYMGEKA